MKLAWSFTVIINFSHIIQKNTKAIHFNAIHLKTFDGNHSEIINFSILTSRALPKGLYRLFWTVLADEFWLAVKLYRHTGTNWLLDPSLCDCMDSLCCDHWQAVVIVGCLVLASLPTPLPSTPALTQDKRRCVARAFQWTCESGKKGWDSKGNPWKARGWSLWFEWIWIEPRSFVFSCLRWMVDQIYCTETWGINN